MAKRIKSSVITQVSYNKQEFERALPVLAGYRFRWVAPATRNKKGWGIWTPVTCDSAIGKEITEQLASMPDRFMGLNLEANYYYNGASSILAFTTDEKAKVHNQMLHEKAEHQIKQIDAAELRRNVIIPAAPGYGKKG